MGKGTEEIELDQSPNPVIPYSFAYGQMLQAYQEIWALKKRTDLLPYLLYYIFNWMQIIYFTCCLYIRAKDWGVLYNNREI